MTNWITTYPNILDRAHHFAQTAHAKQVRKYSGIPYFGHLHEVATILTEHGFDDEIVAAGYLHDVIEDQPVSREVIEEWFGRRVAQLVWEVTDQSKPSDGNRKVRKEIDRQWLSKACPAAQSIKLADLISNGKDITENDPKFAEVFLTEKASLLEVLRDGDEWLYTRAKWALVACQERLVQIALEKKGQ